MNEFSIIISVSSLTVAVVAVVYNNILAEKMVKQARIAANLSAVSEIKLKLIDIPSALKFHGITQKMLDSHEVTPQELAYLASNFIAGQIYFEMSSRNTLTPFEEGDYRENICKSEHTQKAWPLLEKLIDDTPYRDKIKLTIEKYAEQV